MMLGRFGIGPGLNALHDLEVEFDPEALVLGIDEAVRVAAIAVDEAITLGQAAVAEQDRDLVQAFG